MGFCLFNSIAVGAAAALAKGLERVLIVDWDVHHGNGTQDIFYEDLRVGFLSIHRYPFYPGTGRRGRPAAAAGWAPLGTCRFGFGTPRKEYIAAFRSRLKTWPIN